MSSSRPNILWITLDSVRADHTSLHGYERNTTPELARIASSSGGVNFKHGTSHSTRTPVSVPSMLTGLYPSRHQMIGEQSGDLIPDSMITAPELFADCGYRTIGISENGYAGKAKDLDKRFEEFTKSPLPIRELLLSRHRMSLLKYGLKLRKHGSGFTLDKSAHKKQNSFFTTEITKRKLRQSSDSARPFFCYVHYNDPHHPYIPPREYQDEYISEINATSEEALDFAEDIHNNLEKYIAKGVPFTENQWDMLYAMYDATIKYVDECVGQLFNFIQDNFEDTIVVITSDHGDLFGEANLLGHHIVLHDALIHVPLVVHGLTELNQCAEKPTQHIDVMQTLLSLAGADVSQFQGYDLTHQCREIAISQDLRASVDNDNIQNYQEIRKHNSNVDLSHLPKSLLTSVRTTDFKLLHTNEWIKLHRLPDESKDVQDEYPSVYEELFAFLQDWLETEGEPFKEKPKQAELTQETKQHLQNMGYLE